MVSRRAAAPSNWREVGIWARVRDSGYAGELYRAGTTYAGPETRESSLQLSKAGLVDLGVAMGPVIASIHERRAELLEEIKALAPEMDRAPSLQRRRLRDAAGTGDDPHE